MLWITQDRSFVPVVWPVMSRGSYRGAGTIGLDLEMVARREGNYKNLKENNGRLGVNISYSDYNRLLQLQTTSGS